MPIFQENLEQEDLPHEPNTSDRGFGHTEPIPIQTTASDVPVGLLRRLSEESIRTELCDGPIPDSPPRPTTPELEHDVSNAVSDRAELIERLKRGESPTWVPNRHVRPLPDQSARYSHCSQKAAQLESLFQQHAPRSPTRSSRPPSRRSPAVLPAAEVTPEKERSDAPVEDGEVHERFEEGLNIERPRSALHSGNFTPEESPPTSQPGQEVDPHADVLEHFRPGSQPWLATSPPRDFATPFLGFDQTPYRRETFVSGTSSLSSSLSSSFVYKPPTSPLVQ